MDDETKRRLETVEGVLDRIFDGIFAGALAVGFCACVIALTDVWFPR